RLLRDLNEIATRVVKHRRGYRPHRYRRLSEMNSRGPETLVFRVDVLDSERSEGNPVFHECACERPHGGMGPWLEQQLGAVGIGRRDDSQPAGLPPGTRSPPRSLEGRPCRSTAWRRPPSIGTTAGGPQRPARTPAAAPARPRPSWPRRRPPIPSGSHALERTDTES